MFNLIVTIALYCMATNTPDSFRSKRKCMKELRQCVYKKRINPVGTEEQYLQECITKKEEK